VRRCPRCDGEFPDDVENCPDDGTPLFRRRPLTPAPEEADADPFSITGPDVEAETLIAPVASRPVVPAEDVTLAAEAVASPSDEPEDDEALVPGTVLGSGYEVIRRLGQGGMGAVYEVEHVRLKKRFAAKVLRREVSAIPEYVKRLEREAVAAGHIEHPNIVQVVNLDETDEGQVYLVMEYLEGQDLGQVLESGPLAPNEALTLAIQVANAVHAAHEEGIVHRDLKPENIFLARKADGVVVKVVDFGISKVDLGDEAVRLTKTGHVLGTPMYMSPEHAQGDVSLDARADVYSLGVILYETLTGKPPFEGTKPLEVMLKHVSADVPRLAEKRADLPIELDVVVMRALAKDPADRYQTMAEVAGALAETGKALGIDQAALPDVVTGRHRSLTSLTPGPVSVTSKPTESRGPLPMRWLLAAVAAVLFATVVTWGVATTGRREPASPSPAALAPPVARPPEPPASAPAAPPPVAAAEVELSLASSPPGATASVDGRVAGRTPLTLRVPRGPGPLTVRLDLKGHAAHTELVVPDADKRVEATLAPSEEEGAAAPPPARRPTSKAKKPAAGFRNTR